MFLLEWTSDDGLHQFKGGADEIMKELVPFFQAEGERNKVDAFLAVVKVGDRYEEPSRYSIERLS